MGIMAGVGGLVGGLAGMFGGNQASNVQLPPQWNMPNMTGAANNAYGGIQGLGQFGTAANTTMGPAANTFSNLYSNPYAGGFQSGAGMAGGLGQNAALGAYGVGGGLQNLGMSTAPYAQSLFNSGFDPQNALYARTAQQLQDQVRAGESARGIATTPYGAGLENQAMSNFNIDWQNNLLNRQMQSAQGAGGLLTQGGNLAGLGVNMQGAAPGQFLQSSMMPYSAYGAIGGDQNQAIQAMLSATNNAQGISNVPLQDWFSYLGAGNQAGNVANQQAGLALQQQQQSFTQQRQLGAGLGNSLYGLGQQGFGVFGGNKSGWGNMFGGGSSGGGNMSSLGMGSTGYGFV